MWLWMSVCSALLLGIYDVAKKEALKRNGVYWILVSATALTAVFLSPCLSHGSLSDHLSLVLKARNFVEAMGYPGYFTGQEQDRNKLYIRDVFPVKRRSDGEIFAYNVLTFSLGSGIEASMTVFLTAYNKDPIKKDDIITCKGWKRDGKWFRMTNYEHFVA